MNRYNLIKEYGSWLNGIKWDYFSTLTYKYETNSKRNRMIMNKLSYLLNDSDVKYEMFWINEFHKSGLSTHNHLLYRGNENLKDLINLLRLVNQMDIYKNLVNLSSLSSKIKVNKKLDKS